MVEWINTEHCTGSVNSVSALPKNKTKIFPKLIVVQCLAC